MYFAITHPNRPQDVSILASPRANRSKDKERRYFYCENGCWSGYLKDGMVHVEGSDKPTGPGIVVWEGELPESVGKTKWSDWYNDAINWIREQINAPTY